MHSDVEEGVFGGEEGGFAVSCPKRRLYIVLPGLGRLGEGFVVRMENAVSTAACRPDEIIIGFRLVAQRGSVCGSTSSAYLAVPLFYKCSGLMVWSAVAYTWFRHYRFLFSRQTKTIGAVQQRMFYHITL